MTNALKETSEEAWKGISKVMTLRLKPKELPSPVWLSG